MGTFASQLLARQMTSLRDSLNQTRPVESCYLPERPVRLHWAGS